MVETIKITYRDGAYRVSQPNWDGGEVVMASDFAELEAEIERLRKAASDWEDRFWRRDAQADRSEALSRTGAVKVKAWKAEAARDALIEEAKDFSERMTSQPWACELIDRLIAALEPAAPEG